MSNKGGKPPPRASARIGARTQRVPTSVGMGWTTPIATNEERRLMMALIEYLHDESESVQVLRYLTTEYRRKWAETMNTGQTLRRVRSALDSMGVEFLKYNADTRKWSYWNDYSEAGIVAWNDSQQVDAPNLQNEDDELEGDNNDEDEDVVKEIVQDPDEAQQVNSPDPPTDKDPPAD
jgi:hypothetical protein